MLGGGCRIGQASEHGRAALEDPRGVGLGEDPGEEALEDELAAKLVDGAVAADGVSAEPVGEGAAECLVARVGILMSRH